MKKYYCHTCKYYSAAKDLKYKNHVNEEGDPLSVIDFSKKKFAGVIPNAYIEVENLPYGKCHLNPPTVTSNGTIWPRVYGESDYCSRWIDVLS